MGGVTHLQQTTNKGGTVVELLFFIVAVWAIGYLIYRAGKRTGSIKGYNVGRRQGQRRR
ncbi:MAG: hypothetical protein ACODAD_13120 [Planctomycetota bacterium]